MANKKKMATLGLFMILFGGLIGISGGFIYNYYKDKSGEEKHSEIANKQNEIVNKQNQIADKVDSTKKYIGDKIDKAAKKTGNTTIKNETKNVVNAPNAVIVTQNQSGGENNVNYFQNEYKSLNETLSNEVERKLGILVTKYPNHPFVSVVIESGNSQRHKIALSLETFFQPKHLGNYPTGNTFTGVFLDHPISVFVNSANYSFANDLINSLKPFIQGEYQIIKDDTFPLDFMRIYLNGQPSFDNNGSVKIN